MKYCTTELSLTSKLSKFNRGIINKIDTDLSIPDNMEIAVRTKKDFGEIEINLVNGFIFDILILNRIK